jgi:DNA-binding NtrC family response regulator
MLDVLVVDDDEIVRESISGALIDAGHQVTEAQDGEQAADLIAKHAFDLAICDVQMPKLDGLTLMRRIRREAPDTAVVIMTAYGKVSDVVDSMRDGAVDYVTKPFDPDEFAVKVVEPIAQRRSLRRKFDDARAGFTARWTGVTVVATSPVMRRVADRICVLAASDVSVLVTGDRGTGKELVARTIHAEGPRREGPFVLVDGALLPELVLASEHGELSDDGAPRDAWFREASGGTLVLDAIEGIPLDVQAHLVRAMSDPGAPARRSMGWLPLGVRLITLARSREDLADRVAAGQFMESLYYRLSGTHLHVPSLVERGEDLWPLVTQLLREIEPPARTIPWITPTAWETLSTYPFPGNVRELRWVLEQALVSASGESIDVEHLPAEVLAQCAGRGASIDGCAGPSTTRVPRSG